MTPTTSAGGSGDDCGGCGCGCCGGGGGGVGCDCGGGGVEVVLRRLLGGVPTEAAVVAEAVGVVAVVVVATDCGGECDGCGTRADAVCRRCRFADWAEATIDDFDLRAGVAIAAAVDGAAMVSEAAAPSCVPSVAAGATSSIAAVPGVVFGFVSAPAPVSSPVSSPPSGIGSGSCRSSNPEMEDAEWKASGGGSLGDRNGKDCGTIPSPPNGCSESPGRNSPPLKLRRISAGSLTNGSKKPKSGNSGCVVGGRAGGRLIERRCH